MPSDPWKVVYQREAVRAYTECLDARTCDANEPPVRDFLRMLIKSPEHTWCVEQSAFSV